MNEASGIAMTALTGQVVIGLINGSFYALLSMGLSIIFGLLHVVNFAHGAQYMLGAFVAWGLLEYAGIGYWPALLIAPVSVAVFGALIERFLLRRLYAVDHVYALLLTFGLAMLLEGGLRLKFGVSGEPYANPMRGGVEFGAAFIPAYRLWVILASSALCLSTWYFIERTKLGSYLRAAHENPMLVRTFGINVPRMLMLTYGASVGLAGLAGVMAAPIYQVSPIMGNNLLVVAFAVVVIGGMGSIKGSIVTGFALGVLEGLSKLFIPSATSIVIFVLMIVVLTIRPDGLFGQERK